MPLSLDEMRAHRPFRPFGLIQTTQGPGFQYAGLTCCVIFFHKAFAIVGRLTQLYSFHSKCAHAT